MTDPLRDPFVKHRRGVKLIGSVRWDIHDLEALSHLALAELRCPFVSLISVFVKHCTVMPSGILAAFDHQQKKAEELRVGIVGVVNVSRRLSK